MEGSSASVPWYRRPGGKLLLGYLIVTSGLGIWFLVASRTDGALTALSASRAVFRTGAISSATPNTQIATLPDAPLFVESDPALGASVEDARLIIVEYSDFECPFCRQFFPTLRAAAAQYGDRLSVVYRDFPIADIHPAAWRLAEAAQCAHEQGAFWQYHDKLFQIQTTGQSVDDSALVTYAQQTGMDHHAFSSCLRSGSMRARVEEDFTHGTALGIRGTPTLFFLIDGDPAKAQRVEGVIPRDQFFTLLERLLGEAQ